jgi:hypothetical protein
MEPTRIAGLSVVAATKKPLTAESAENFRGGRRGGGGAVGLVILGSMAALLMTDSECLAGQLQSGL